MPTRRHLFRRALARIVGYSLLAITVGVLALLALAWEAMGTAPTGEQLLQRIATSAQYDGERFRNPLPERMGSYWTMARRWFEPRPNTRPRTPPPVQKRTAADFPAAADALAVTWIGHSTLLIELDGTTVLTDPIFSERASPLSFLGPARFHPPPLTVDALPTIDVVVLSHDHYDHLDMATIKDLQTRAKHFVVPLGVGEHLRYWGVPAGRIHELDWWQEVNVGSLRLVCTPSRHFSGRGVTDRNRTLWASWALIGPMHRVFFSGDTAMFPGFAEIGARLGPFDLAAIEVGAYDRLWPDVHLGPEQAVDAHVQLGARLMLPVHWGTFDLALHGWTEPIERVQVAAATAHVQLFSPEAGQRVDTRSPPALRAFWPQIPFRTAAEHPVLSTGL